MPPAGPPRGGKICQTVTYMNGVISSEVYCIPSPSSTAATDAAAAAAPVILTPTHPLNNLGHSSFLLLLVSHMMTRLQSHKGALQYFFFIKWLIHILSQCMCLCRFLCVCMRVLGGVSFESHGIFLIL